MKGYCLLFMLVFTASAMVSAFHKYVQSTPNRPHVAKDNDYECGLRQKYEHTQKVMRFHNVFAL